MSSVLNFIKHVERHCKRKGFELVVVNSSFIDIGDNAPSSGYFSEDEKKICVALKTKDFLGILAHEYSHFCQYVEDKEWYEYYSDSYLKMFEWLEGKRIKNIDFHLGNCLELELDCEKRAVEHIKKFNLGINIEDYIQRANAYMYFWRYLKHSRRWCSPYNTPSNNEQIVRVMPTRFLKEYILSDKIKELFEKENI